jgi:Mce-associated membrane protein
VTDEDKVDLEKKVEDAADEIDETDTVDETEAEEAVAETDAETVEPDVDEPKPVPGPPAPAKPTGLSPTRLILPIALVLILVLSAGAAVFTYVALHRGDQKVDQAVAAQVIQSASDGAVALLSYTPETLDQDFSKAKSRLTGDFLNYYTQFTQEIVTPAAKQKSVKTSAAVVRSALSKLEPTSAEVLLFINQSTVSKENPDGSFTASSVKVEMTKVGDDWLISSFDPV